jgi:hypothetical protein
METWIHGHEDIETSIGKRSMEAQATFLNPFTVCSSAKGSLSFVCLFKKKQTEVIRLKTNLTRTCLDMLLNDTTLHISWSIRMREHYCARQDYSGPAGLVNSPV